MVITRHIICSLQVFICANIYAATEDPSKHFANSYAVVIGIGKYMASQWENLDNAENDARAMAELFEEQGFIVKQFTGQDATKEKIIAYLEDDLAPKLSDRDRMIFYFSGHGGTRELGGSDRGYIIPYDGEDNRTSTWIAMEKLRELSDKLGNARHQLFILDACFGGLIATKSSTVSGSTPIERLAERRARQVLTAGGAHEKTPAASSLEGYRSYSHYTAHLLRGLREGAADTHPDGVITANELHTYLQTAAFSDYNTPSKGSLPGDELGDFVFRSPREAESITLEKLPGDVVLKGRDGIETNALKQEILDLLKEKEKLEKQNNELVEQQASYTPQESEPIRTNRILTPAEEAQALYEWKNDIQYSSNSKTIEQFLERYPTGGHVIAAQRKLTYLRKQGR